MRYELKDRDLVIIPENEAEAVYTQKHWHDSGYPASVQETRQYLADIDALSPVVHSVSRNTKEKGGGFFRLEGVEIEVGDPYVQSIQDLTGWHYESQEECMGLDMLPAIKSYGRDVITRAECYGGIVSFDAITQCWCEKGLHTGEDGSDYCLKHHNAFIENMQEKFWYRPNVPEYIGVREGGGLMKKNPKYATGYKEPIRKRAHDPKIWRWYWDQFVKFGATEEQRDILARDAQRDSYYRFSSIPYASSGIHYDDPKGTCNYDGKGRMVSFMTFNEFAQLGR